MDVDNGSVSSTSKEMETKAPHVVSQPVSAESQPSDLSSTSSQSTTQAEALHFLHVKGNITSAELEKMSRDSGEHKCFIKFSGAWHTLKEFKAACEAACLKDWKQSIHSREASLWILLDKGVLTPHATSCTCRICSDDEMPLIKKVTSFCTLTNAEGKSEIKLRIKEGSSENVSSFILLKNTLPANKDARQNKKTNKLPTESSGLKPLYPDDDLTQLDFKTQKLVKMTQLKRHADAIERKAIKEMEQKRLKMSFDSMSLNGNRRQKTLNINDFPEKRCVNCNKLAYLQCIRCQTTPYCSPFCQERDWIEHKEECELPTNK